MDEDHEALTIVQLIQANTNVAFNLLVRLRTELLTDLICLAGKQGLEVAQVLNDGQTRLSDR